MKVPFTLLPPADLIARAKFSSHSLRNTHGRKNLLSFLAIRIREVSLLFVPTYGGGMEIFMKNENGPKDVNFDGIVVPPGCDNPLLKNSGEKIQTFTPSSYTPYVPKHPSHMMSGKIDGISVPKNPSPTIRRNMIEYLSQFQGAYLCLDLWSTNQRKVSRCGILLEIGNDFLVMGDAHRKKLSLIDLKPIKYMNIYCK